MGKKELSLPFHHKRSFLTIGFTWSVFVSLISCASIGRAGENPSSEEGKTMATPILQACEHYFIENDQYPKRLHDLIPEHLESLAWEDLAEKQFKYASQNGGQSFILAFIPEPNQRCDYTTDTRWVCRETK